jgi:hypothetical protein
MRNATRERRAVSERAWFSIPEVSDLLGFHANSIRRMLRAGTLSGRRVGGIWFVFRHQPLLEGFIPGEKPARKRQVQA